VARSALSQRIETTENRLALVNDTLDCLHIITQRTDDPDIIAEALRAGRNQHRLRDDLRHERNHKEHQPNEQHTEAHHPHPG